MNDFKENLEKMLNLQKDEEKLPVIMKQPIENNEESDESDESAEFAKTKLKKYIEIGEGVLEESEAVARTTGEPQAINAFTNLLGKLGDMSSNVLKNDGEKAKIKKIKRDSRGGGKSTSNVTNNTAVYIGTTTDLLKQLRDKEFKTIDGEIVK